MKRASEVSRGEEAVGPDDAAGDYHCPLPDHRAPQLRRERVHRGLAMESGPRPATHAILTLLEAGVGKATLDNGSLEAY